jgi:hypothetical protein
MVQEIERIFVSPGKFLKYFSLDLIPQKPWKLPEIWGKFILRNSRPIWNIKDSILLGDYCHKCSISWLNWLVWGNWDVLLWKLDFPFDCRRLKSTQKISFNIQRCHRNPRQSSRTKEIPIASTQKKIQVKSPMWAQKLMKVQGQVNKLRLMSFLWRKLGVTFHCVVLFVQQLNRWYWISFSIFGVFWNKSRYVTKIKICSGFMRVHRILKVWSLLTTKIIISQKKMVLKRSTAQIPAARLVHNDPPLNFFFFFFKARIYWKFGFFWKACIITFQKSNICPNK